MFPVFLLIKTLSFNFLPCSCYDNYTHQRALSLLCHLTALVEMIDTMIDERNNDKQNKQNIYLVLKYIVIIVYYILNL